MHPAFITPLPLFSQTHRIPARTPRTPRRPRRLPVLLSSDQDHYKILDIPQTADQQTIKRAYRRTALKNHPDVSDAPDARERFLRVQEAYAVLSNPSKRAAYDRRKASPFSSSTVPGFDGFSGFDPDFAKRWRERNPMPSDIDDSLGSIFSDLFTGFADVVGGPSGVVEDFVEFLEKRVDGFRDDGLSDILKSNDIDVLETELEDARFVLKQLKSRKQRAEDEATTLRERASQWSTRAERADARREYDVRDAARERQNELNKDAHRFTERARKTTRLIEDQKQRIQKITDRLDQVHRQAPKGGSAATSTTPSGTGSPAGTSGKGVDQRKSQKQAIDEELEKMKKEMGL